MVLLKGTSNAALEPGTRGLGQSDVLAWQAAPKDSGQFTV